MFFLKIFDITNSRCNELFLVSLQGSSFKLSRQKTLGSRLFRVRYIKPPWLYREFTVNTRSHLQPTAQKEYTLVLRKEIGNRDFITTKNHLKTQPLQKGHCFVQLFMGTKRKTQRSNTHVALPVFVCGTKATAYICVLPHAMLA